MSVFKALLVVASVSALRVKQTSTALDVNSDLDALMQKYDEKEKPKPVKKVNSDVPGGPSVEAV